MFEEIKRRLDKIEDLQLRTREDIAALKVKAGIWGLLGGLLPVVIGLTTFLLTR